MPYLVIESHRSEDISYIGPFPSQCQAMSYAELMMTSLAADDRRSYRVNTLLTPHIMPTKIHD